MILRPEQHRSGEPVMWEDELTQLLDELLETQQEMLDLLDVKRKAMTKRDIAAINALQPTEEALCERLLSCQRRRNDVLEVAGMQELPNADLQTLSRTVATGSGGAIETKIMTANQRSTLLRHQSLTNWIIAQRNLLHVSQLLEIIATGGNKVPTYGEGQASAHNGFVLDQEA